MRTAPRGRSARPSADDRVATSPASFPAARAAPRRPFAGRSSVLPAVLVLAGTALFFAVLWPRLDAGHLWHHDEILTGERAREMLVSGDPWVVRLNGKPNFHKPPLQYWATAALLRAFPDHRELAVRLPSTLAAALCLLATAALGRVAWPDDPLAGPAAAFALTGCGFWVHYARMGMLDAGAALGVTGALLGAELARRRGDPRWWWLTGVAATLGAWQKAPYALGAWGVAVLGRVRRGELSRAPGRWPRALRGAALLTGALVLAWPAWQVARFGMKAVTGGQSESTGNLFNLNKSSGFQPWLYAWWLVRDWGLMGVLAPVAVVTAAAITTTKPRADETPDPFRGEAGVMVLVGWGVTACLPYRTERYLIFLLPVAALLTVRLLRRDLAGRPRRHGSAFLAAALVSTVPVAAFHYRKPAPERTDLRAAARALGAVEAAGVAGRTGPAATLVLDRATATGINAPYFVMFYGELGRRARLDEPWTQGWMVFADRRRGVPGARFRGVCRAKAAEAFGLAGGLGPVRVSRHGEWAVWEADGNERALTTAAPVSGNDDVP